MVLNPPLLPGVGIRVRALNGAGMKEKTRQQTLGITNQRYVEKFSQILHRCYLVFLHLKRGC